MKYIKLKTKLNQNQKTVIAKTTNKFHRLLLPTMLVLVSLLSFFMAFQAHTALAAGDSSTLNFQARLLTASGAIVPDGSYNVEFKLYNALTSSGSSQGSCTGDANCLWVEDYTGGNTLTVKDGYLSVYLGSVNSFPSTIDWEQPLYLGINIGGIGTPSWDGEMAPRIALTAIPYSFIAGQLANTTSGGNRQDLSFGTDTGNDTIALPDMSGNVFLLQSSPSSQTGGFIATGTGTVSSILTSSGSDDVDTSSSGVLYVGNGNATSITLGANTSTGSNKSLSVAGATTLEDATDSASALAVDNNSAQAILSVNSSTNNTVFGNTSSVAGSVQFDDGADTHIITINTGATSGSYTLTLPLAGPSTSQCLETNSSTATQLVFANCANTNSSITEVQSVSTSGTNSSTTSTTLSVTPSAVGDVLIYSGWMSTASDFISSITGGGVIAWTKINASTCTTTCTGINRDEMWMGIVNSTSATSITVHYSSIPNNYEDVLTEFTAANVSANTTWGVDTSGGSVNTTGSTTVAYPSLTSEGSSEVYVGYAQSPSAGSAGSSPGFTYVPTTGNNIVVYTSPTTYATMYSPTSSQASSDESNSVAAILVAIVNSTAINNSTTQQLGNFNVEAGNSGTIAGVLQANTSGTADILDLRNGSGTNVATFGDAGAVTYTNSTNSTTAFQVQNASGSNILAVDTTNTQVDLGGLIATPGTVVAMQAPATPTVTPTGGTSASVSYAYEVTAVSANGAETLASTAGTTATGRTFTLLSASIYNAVSWSAVTGASYYKIYRTTGGTTQGLVGEVASSPFDDTGLTAGAQPPALESSGGLTASTSYYYEVTALDDTGGQTLPSAQVTGTTNTTYLATTLSWAPIAGARAYDVYRSTTTGVYTTDSYYTVYTNSYTDINATATGTNVVPPTATGAYANNVDNNTTATLTIGNSGTSTGQLYVGGQVPVNYIGSITTGLNDPIGNFVSGNYDYVANSTNNALTIFDISNPANPVRVGSSTNGLSQPYSVYVSGRYAYVASYGNSALVIFDISNPANPVEVGSSISGLDNPYSVYVSGRYAYVTNENNNALVIFDISNPASPVKVSSTTSGINNAYSVYVQGRYAYVVSTGNSDSPYF